jgi:hypothetical protein
LRPSLEKELARELISAGIEGLLFPSFVGGDDNLIVYRVNCGRRALSLKNEREVIDQMSRIVGRHKSRIADSTIAETQRYVSKISAGRQRWPHIDPRREITIQNNPVAAGHWGQQRS